MPDSLPDSSDVQQAYRLIHELCEAGADTHAWRERLMIGLEELTASEMSISYLFAFSLDPADIHPKSAVYIERGTPEVWKRFVATGDLNSNPVTPFIMQRFGTDFTVKRDELIDEATWTASDHFRDVVEPAGMGDMIYSQVAVKEPRVVDGIGLARALGKPNYSPADVEKVRFIHQELARLWNRDDPISVHTLPPRQREVLYGIQRGEGRKVIAEKLGLSQHTVHSYEKALFERAGVASRGELLAKLAGVIRPNLLP